MRTYETRCQLACAKMYISYYIYVPFCTGLRNKSAVLVRRSCNRTTITIRERLFNSYVPRYIYLGLYHFMLTCRLALPADVNDRILQITGDRARAREQSIFQLLPHGKKNKHFY